MIKTLTRIVVAAAFAFPLIGAEGVLRDIELRDLTPHEIAMKPHDGRFVFMRSAVFDPLRERPDVTSTGIPRASMAARREYAIVQFRSDDASAREQLAREGVRFLGYLPDNAYQVHIPATMKSALMANASVRWVGELEPAMKVDPRLWPSRTVKVQNVRVVPFADASVAKTIALLKATGTGITVSKSFDKFSHFVEVTVPPGREDDFVRAAAAMDTVAWIEPNDAMHWMNANSSGAIQGNQVGDAGRVIFGHGITGAGQIVAVADSGLDSDMCFFRNHDGHDEVTDATSAITDEPGPLFPANKVIGYWVQEDADAYDTGAASFHGTHTTGTVAGDSLAHPSSSTDAGFDPGDGMAPNAQIIFQDIGRNDSSGTLTGGDPYAMYLQASRGGARIHSNSYGSTTKGAYTAYDQLLDRYLFDHDEMAIFFSAGNEGAFGAGSTGSPGNAKNVVTVGATQSGVSTTIALFSSRGPARDGRVKPDIVAPGKDIRSAGGDEDHGDGNCLLATMDGTSMSAPTVAGGATLLREYFTDGFYPSGTKNPPDTMNPTATAVKAALLNGTIVLPNATGYPNGTFGWGKILLSSNLYFPGSPRKLRLWDLPNDQGLTTGESRSFSVNVASGQEFRATLVWSDPEGTLGAAKALVNDLDLTVTTEAGAVLGNVFDATGVSVSGGSADRTNNVEQVRFTAPVGGTYSITVSAPSVPGNGRAGTNRQGFALAVSAASCSTGVSATPGGVLTRTNPTRGVDVTWTAVPGASVTQIYRATGTNPPDGDFRYIGSAAGTSFTDTRAQGGYSYTYRVRGADGCGEGPASSPVRITSSGLCDLAPQFTGISAASAEGTSCQINLSWPGATSSCPLGNSIRYNIYRSSSPDFIPSGEPYASTTARTYADTGVVSGTTYYYVVRAEDTTSASSGPHGGNLETNVVRLFATAFGPPGTNGTWHDDAGDTGAFLSADSPWRITSLEAKGGQRSYHNGPDFDTYPNSTCASLVTPAIPVSATSELVYNARYNLEYQWDGVVVEISADNGSTWTDLPPADGYPDTLAMTQGDKGLDEPANACGFTKERGAFTGPPANAALTPWTEYRSSLAAYAGKTVRIRWRFTSDPGLELDGFYLDEISITNAQVPGSCTPVAVAPHAQFDSAAIVYKGVTMAFQDTSSGPPTSWRWTFGDGSSSTQRNPTHVYTTLGTYEVTLEVTNAFGSDQVSKTLTVIERPPGPGKRRSSRH